MAIQTKQQLFELIQHQQQQFRAYGVKRVGLFGSFLHDQQNQQSDVDILVEFDPKQKSFTNFMQLLFFCEELLGRKVDLITRESLSPYIGPHILQEVEYVPLND